MSRTPPTSSNRVQPPPEQSRRSGGAGDVLLGRVLGQEEALQPGEVVGVEDVDVCRDQLAPHGLTVGQVCIGGGPEPDVLATGVKGLQLAGAPIVAGAEPYGVTATSDPRKMLFTNRKSDPRGLGVIQAAADPERWVTIDAALPPEEVLDAAWRAVSRVCSSRPTSYPPT